MRDQRKPLAAVETHVTEHIQPIRQGRKIAAARVEASRHDKVLGKNANLARSLKVEDLRRSTRRGDRPGTTSPL